jgi:hypothetical protein
VKIGGDSMANIPFYILFGKKNDNYFYIANTNPVIWAVDIRKVKPFVDRYSAEYAVLRDYDNYQAIKANLNNGSLDEFYVAERDMYGEVWRVKIL